MALNEHNATRQYTKYKRHVNESSERVDAGTVNSLQDDLNVQQHETNQVKDTAFEERVYTIFNNNLYANAMFVDYYRTGEYLNQNESSGVVLDYAKTQLSLKQDTMAGTAISTTVYSVHGEGIEMNDFFLITNEHVPQGASIKYYLQTYTGERWPIKPNELKLPMHLSSHLIYGFKLVAELRANALKESPIINGYAVLYWDAQVEKNYGMTNPDLMRFPTVQVGDDDGMTILVRDRAQDDKVVQVLTPLDTVNLIFDWNDKENPGRLAFVHDYWPDYEGQEVTQINKLHYGPYLNSLDEIENVLQKIQQSTNIGNNKANVTFNDLMAEMENMKNNQPGGDTT